MKTESAALSRLLASLEVARIELEYASADVASAEAWKDDPKGLDTMLAKLRLARAALAAAQETLDDAVTAAPVLYTLATGGGR